MEKQKVSGCTAIKDLSKLYLILQPQGGKKRRSTKKRKSKRSHKRGRHTKRIR